MITLYGIKLIQKDHTIYLTTATVEELKSWMEMDRVCADIWKREKSEGYQRTPDAKKFKKIADYIEGKTQIEATLLPNSIILNLRTPGAVDFVPLEQTKSKKTTQLGTIKINDEALPFYEVDGQHRIRGLIEAYNDAKGSKTKDKDELNEISSYPVPLTIIEGLDRPSEAVQFVIINTTQKKVDPALVLRILHRRYKDVGEKLAFFLKGQAWRFDAIEVSDTLNFDPNSPWCDKITAPGDERKGRIISEQNFVNTLEMVYQKMEQNIIQKFLPLYWRAISSLWKECVGKNAVKYSLQRTNGTIVFHWLFPLAYFKNVAIGGNYLKNFIKILQPVYKKYLPTFWVRGGKAKLYTSKGSQKELVDEMIAFTFLKGKKIKLGKVDRDLLGTKHERSWHNAAKLIPLRFYHPFAQDRLKDIDSGAAGVYILYSFGKRHFYVGRSGKGDLKARLLTHVQDKEREFDIFNYRLSKDAGESHDLECALYHLFPKDLLANREHPSSVDGKKCPFCKA